MLTRGKLSEHEQDMPWKSYLAGSRTERFGTPFLALKCSGRFLLLLFRNHFPVSCDEEAVQQKKKNVISNPTTEIEQAPLTLNFSFSLTITVRRDHRGDQKSFDNLGRNLFLTKEHIKLSIRKAKRGSKII